MYLMYDTTTTPKNPLSKNKEIAFKQKTMEELTVKNISKNQTSK